MRRFGWLAIVSSLILAPSWAWAAAKWTVMVYMAADNNLEQAAIDDINEMEQIGSTPDVQVVVQVDRAPGYDASNGNWEDTRRYLIALDANTLNISSPVIEYLGEKNMGDPATLNQFVNWCISNYPAEHYFLILWDHGAGWQKAVSGILESASNLDGKSPTGGASGEAFVVSPATRVSPLPPSLFTQSGFKYACEDMTDNDKLYNHETQSALSGVGKLDIIGYDACVMAMVETAYQLRDEAFYMVASEENEPGDGWPYDDLLSWMTANPTFSAAQVCSVTVLTYANHWAPIPPDKQTLSAIKLAQIRNVCTSLNALVTAIVGGSSWAEIFAMPQPERFGEKNPFDDLYDIADLLRLYVSAPAIVSAANSLRSTVASAVLINRTESSHPYAHGLSVFFPKTPTAFWENQGSLYGSPANQVDFADSTLWTTFLSYYFGGGAHLGDVREPDDLPTQAGHPLSPYYESQSLISSTSDVDYWLVHTGSAETLTLILNSPGNADLDLRLYDSEGTGLLASSLRRGNGVPDTVSFTTSGPANLYVSVTGFNSFSTTPYSLLCQENGYGIGGFQLSFDDGDPAAGWYSNVAGDAIGTTFNLPTYPMVLDRVWINIKNISGTGSGNGSFYLLLYDNYGPIVDPIALGELTPSATGWNYLDLTSEQRLVFTSCFVGVWYDGVNTPVVGSDSFTNGRDYYYSSTAGTWQPLQSSLFIRLEVSYPCTCPCVGDPVCDGFSNIQDVVATVNAAFRGDTPIRDFGCPTDRTDVNGSGFTNIQDVVAVVNVAFRGGTAEEFYGDPCQ